MAKINDPAMKEILPSVEKIPIEKTGEIVDELTEEKPTGSKFSRIIGTLGRSISRSSIREDFQIDPFHDQPEVSMVSRVIGNISRSMSRSSIFSNGSESEASGVFNFFSAGKLYDFRFFKHHTKKRKNLRSQ